MENEFEDRILFAEGDDQDDDDTLETDDEETEDDKDEDDSDDSDKDDADDSDDSEDDKDSDDSEDDKDADEKGDEKKDDKKDDQNRHSETPEAKRARLKRQLSQHEKKHGFTSDSSNKKDDKKEEQGTLTYRDTIALTNAKVHEDDVDEVIEYARFKKISIAEALQSSVIKSSLSEKIEQRKTAEATNTGRTRPGNARASGDKLLERAKATGELPTSDADIAALAKAEIKRRKNKK